jgi:hypothetical protein
MLAAWAARLDTCHVVLKFTLMETYTKVHQAVTGHGIAMA